MSARQGIPPAIGVTACLVDREGFGYHQVGDKYVDAVVQGAGGLPLLLPALGPRLDLNAVLDTLDGLLVTGSPSNVEPHHYGGGPPPADSPRDPHRDATTLPLIKRALDRGVPLFAICRGVQELNVALGGSLHQEVHELPGRRDHRSDKRRSLPERYELAHEITLRPGGTLQTLLDGAATIRVNSLHGQAIDRPAERLAVEAIADDGTIEAVRVIDAPAFALGVQWHPEWRVLDNPVSRRLFAAFGTACRERQSVRHQRPLGRSNERPDERSEARRRQRHGALAAGA